MSAVAPWHQIHPIPRGWLSENILAARLGEDFSLDIPFHRTGFIGANAILPKTSEVFCQDIFHSTSLI
jgi:hypothetical protein